MVEIFLRVEGRYFQFLSVPLNEIQPLCTRPLKWLRFVAFAICGARGHLFGSTGVGTRPVDYETCMPVETSTYYYVPEGPFCFIDFHGLNERMTSSIHTQRRSNFRSQVIARDGPRCIFTLEDDDACEAVHILPRSKGSEVCLEVVFCDGQQFRCQYICKIIRDRSGLYVSSQRPNISDIDDILNGVFMSNNLHSKFGKGAVAFMKTPNFALEPQDIPMLRLGAIPQHRLTLHKLAPSGGLFPIPCLDANYSPAEDPPPPAILVDYMYGVAAYKRWKLAAIQPIVEQYFTDHYKSIPCIEEFDDPCDADYGGTPSAHGHGHSSKRGLSEAMDEMNAFLMCLSGITPQAIAEKWQKEEEETQLKAQEESRAKVVEWLQWEIHPV